MAILRKIKYPWRQLPVYRVNGARLEVGSNLDHGLSSIVVGAILYVNARIINKAELPRRTQHLLQSKIHDCTTKQDLRALVNAWFPVLDELFFFSLLGKSLSGKVKIFHDPESLSEGFFDPTSNTININLGVTKSMGKAKYTSGENHLATLLHEMVHAALDNFSCMKRCFREKHEDPNWGVGYSHGAVWCNVMACLEDQLANLVDWKGSERHCDVAGGGGAVSQ